MREEEKKCTVTAFGFGYVETFNLKNRRYIYVLTMSTVEEVQMTDGGHNN